MGNRVCRKCNGLTNTAVCDWIDSNDDKADECFLKFEDGKWVKGCGYETATGFNRDFADKILTEQNEK